MSYKVTVRPSGREFTVEGEETILAAALRSGVGLPYGCKNGACGTCKSKGLEGEWAQGPHSSSALTADEQAQGRLLVCCSRPLTDLVIEARELTGFGDIPIKKMPCRIASIERPAPDVAIVTLQLPASERLQFRAGQYLEFILRDGSRRSYSMATAPHADEKIALHIRHMPGGLFTDALFGVAQPALKERDILRIEAPLGTFFLREESARPIVLLASGTGFAPIKAMLRHLIHTGSTRPVRVYWGVRTPADLYEGEVMAAWADAHDWLGFVPVMSEAGPEWSGRRGWVHEAVLEDIPDLSGVAVYAAGPPPMIEAVQDAFPAHGLAHDRLYFDSFEYGAAPAGA